ncbi:MAG: hemerythrin family protein [Thermodesulfobacteriota bacterium]
MPTLRWDPCLETGIEEIDWEHRRLLNIVNRLLDAMARGRGEAAVRPVFRDLVRHAEEHFAHEENYMRGMGYPKAEEHAAEHRRMAERLARFGAALDSEDPPGAMDLSALLSGWLMDHVLTWDREYVAFSRGRANGDTCLLT